MPKHDYCCLCASDEGVFLDIFSTTQQLGNNRRLVDELETCLSVKVDETDALSSKLCHKCAFELGQCNEFLDKYHNVRRISKFRYQSRCCLCQIDEKEGYLFDLSKEFRTSVDPVEKIEKCFNSNLSQREASQRKICLLCRYSLDLLFDLKNLASDVSSKLTKLAENNLCPSNLPKTETLVVVRNTTHPSKRKLKIQTSSDSENDSQTMARNRTNSKKSNETKSTGKTATRTCGECRSTVEDGIDMYRVHQTGLTVCKMCWITMDPLKSLRSKRKATNVPERSSTRLCTVYLKDVLGTASSHNEETYKVKKGGKVNTAHVATDENSENETNLRKKSQEPSKVPAGSVEAESSGQGSDDCKNTRTSRHVKRPMISESEKSNKKPKLSVKKSSSETSVAIDLPQEKISPAEISDSAESDVSGSRKQSRRRNKSETNQPIEAPQQEHNSAQRAKSPQLVEKPKSKIPSPKSMKTVADDNTPIVGKNVKSHNKKIKPSIRMKSSFNMTNPYECKVCKVNYRNKIMGMKHELTHFKQLEIKIQKIDTQEKIDDDVVTEEVCSNASDEDANRNENGKEATPTRLPVADEVESNKRAARSDRKVNQASKVEQPAKKSISLRKRTPASEEKITLVSQPDKPDDAELHNESIEENQKNTESILNNDEAEQLTSTTPDSAVEMIDDPADMAKSDGEVTETNVDPDSIEKPEISEKPVDDSEKTPEKDAIPEANSSKECATTTAKKDETSEEPTRPPSKRLQSLRKRATSNEKVIESRGKRGKSAQKIGKTIETSKNSSDNNTSVEIKDKIAERSSDDETKRVTNIEADDDEDCHISEVVSKPTAAISTEVESHVQTKEDVTEKGETNADIQTIDSGSSDDEEGKNSATNASVSTKSDTTNQDEPLSKQNASDDCVTIDEQIPITINDDVDTNLEMNTENQTDTRIVAPIEEERLSDKKDTPSEECSERGTEIQPTKENQSASETISHPTIDLDDEDQPNDINKSDDAEVEEKEKEEEKPENRTQETNKEKNKHEKMQNEADKEEKEDEDEKEKKNEEEQETEECVVEDKEEKETKEDANDAEKANLEEEVAEEENGKENQNKMDNRKQEESELKTSEKTKVTKSKGANKEAKSSSPKKKTDGTEKEESISLLSATDALQEVIELAEAEVQKRADDVSTLPETLEDITNEINNLIDEDDVMIVPPDEENSSISVQEVTTDA